MNPGVSTFKTVFKPGPLKIELLSCLRTQRSKELFPPADVLVDYLRDFAAEQRDFIRYNSKAAKGRQRGGKG